MFKLLSIYQRFKFSLEKVRNMVLNYSYGIVFYFFPLIANSDMLNLIFTDLQTILNRSKSS